MAGKRRGKAPQWIKVDGIGWVKVKVTRCPTRRAYGSVTAVSAKVDMSRRHEVHVVRPTGYTTVGSLGLPVNYNSPKEA